MLKSLFKDTAIYGLADFLFKFISFATFPFFTYVLSVDEFGVYSLLITLSSLIGLMIMCGLNSAVQRLYLEKNAAPENRHIIVSTGLWCFFISTCLMGCLFIIGLFFFPNLWDEKHQITSQMLIWTFLCGVGMQIITFCLDVIRVEFQPWKYTLLIFIQNALLISLSLFLVIGLKLGVSGYIAATSLAYLTMAPLCLWMIRHHLCLCLNYKIAKQMLHFGYPFIFAGFGYWMFASMDRWMLGELSNYNEVGLYSIAFKIASVLVFINFAFGQAWNPIALRAYHSDPAYSIFYSRLLSIWFFTLIAISLFTSFFGYEILMLLTPLDYWKAAYLLPCICMSLALYGTTPILAMGITLENKTYHYSFAIGLAALSNFFLNWILIPSHGAQGAAIATLCSNFILWMYYLRCSQSLHPIPLETKKLSFCLFIALIGILFNVWINNFSWNYVVMSYKVGFFTALLGISSLILLYWKGFGYESKVDLKRNF